MNDEPECYTNKNAGCKEWRLNGRLYRLDGPALEYADGGNYWFIHDRSIRHTSLELSIGQSIPWYYDDIALVIKQINHTLFQVLVGNKKEYVFSTSKQ